MSLGESSTLFFLLFHTSIYGMNWGDGDGRRRGRPSSRTQHLNWMRKKGEELGGEKEEYDVLAGKSEIWGRFSGVFQLKNLILIRAMKETEISMVVVLKTLNDGRVVGF